MLLDTLLPVEGMHASQRSISVRCPASFWPVVETRTYAATVLVALLFVALAILLIDSLSRA
jgi:hypothetical protein